MNLKSWQLITLFLGGVFTLCLVCLSASLVLSVLFPSSVHTEASIESFLQTSLPTKKVEFGEAKSPKISQSDIPPTPTNLPTDTPSPTESFSPSGLAACIPAQYYCSVEFGEAKSPKMSRSDIPASTPRRAAPSSPPSPPPGMSSSSSRRFLQLKRMEFDSATSCVVSARHHLSLISP